MMKIAILDDEAIQRNQIEKLVEHYFEIHEDIYYELRLFSDANKLFNYIYEHGSFDVYLLDVVMPEINGIEVGKQLRKMNETSPIVYLSYERSYSLDAFSVHAYHYLIKPIHQEHLFKLLDDLCEQFKRTNTKYTIVKTKESVEKINLDDINYVELLKRRLYYHLSDGTTIISTTLHTTFEKTVQDLTKDSRFMMGGVSYVMNLHQIASIKEKQVNFKNGSSITPPRKYIPIIKSQWLEFWLQDS